MTDTPEAMPAGVFLRRVARVALDPALLLFAAFVAFVLDFGFGAAQSRMFLVPGVIAIVFATSALVKYATLVTRAVALGNPVPAADNAVFDYFRRPWAFAPWLAIAAIAALAWWLHQTLGPRAATVYLVVVLPLLPAIVAVVSVNASATTLLRIHELGRVIRILGWDYAKILCGWAAIIGLSHVLPVGGYVAFGYVLPVGGFASTLLLCLQILWLFSSTGVVLYHHYLPLGVPVERLPVDERRARQRDANILRDRRQALDEAYGYFSRGNEVGGLRRLRTYLEAGDDDDAWAWFVDRTGEWESPRAFLLLARNHLSHLLARGDDGAALDLLLRCMRRDPEFAPLPEDRAPLRALLAGHRWTERAMRWR